MNAASLRDARASLLADTTLRGRAFGHALSELLDLALVRHFEAGRGNLPVALIALGSYGRQELCPGSDVDVLLVHAVRGKSRAGVRELAEQCWYPLWDAGFVTGHSTRTIM